jgi:predicted PurR-regulated permease PerM
MMSTRMRDSSMVVWFVMVTAILAAALFAGGHVTLATCAVVLAVGLIPPAMRLRLRPAEVR